MSKVLLQEKNERLLSKVENLLNWVFSPSFLLSLKIYIEKKNYKIKNLTIKIFVIFFSLYLAAWLIHTIKKTRELSVLYLPVDAPRRPSTAGGGEFVWSDYGR